MAINRSRYSNKFDWAGPKPKREAKTEAEKWRYRFVVAVIVLGAVIVILLVVLGILGYRYATLTPNTTTVSEDDIVNTATWQKYSNSDFGVGVEFPETWTSTESKNASNSNLLHVKITGTRSDDASKRASFNVDVFENNDKLTLAEWITRFATNGLETSDTTLGGLPAKTGVVRSTDSTPDQTVIYTASDPSHIVAINYFQSVDDAVLAQVLTEMVAKVTIAAPVATITTVTKGKGPFDLVYMETSGTTHVFKTLDVSTKKSTQVYSDADESQKITGEPGAARDARKIFALFGDKKLYQIDLAKSAARTVLATETVTGSVVRAAADGSVVGVLLGERGAARSIALFKADGTRLDDLNLESAVNDFALADDGNSIAVAQSGRMDVRILTLTGSAKSTLAFAKDQIAGFTWNSTDDAVGITADPTGKRSTKSEIYAFISDAATQLTKDAAVQMDGQIAPDSKTIVYLGAASVTSSKATLWQIGVDGKNDTQLLGANAYDLIGFMAR